jgi:Ca2+-binding RTX toxin-like protein
MDVELLRVLRRFGSPGGGPAPAPATASFASTALGAAGALNPARFFAGVAAHDADDRIIYNKLNGALYFDSNGNAAGGVTLLATLLNKPADVAANDFVVI